MIHRIILNHLFFLLVYSFLGWIIESIYVSIEQKRPVSSGFLYGPLIPVYGFGALLNIILIETTQTRLPIFLQLLIVTLTATILEYITSYFMEKFLSIRLWDYSNEKFNLNGRICLRYSVYWFLLSAVNTFLVYPFVFRATESLNLFQLEIIVFLSAVYSFTDLFFSARLYHRLGTIIYSVKNNLEIPENLLKRLSPKNPRFYHEITKLLRPIRQFNNIRNIITHIQTENYKKTLNSIRNIFDQLLKKKTGHLWAEGDYRLDDKFNSLIKPVIQKPEFQKLKQIKDKQIRNAYEDSIQKAWLVYRISKLFESLNQKELVKGTLLQHFHQISFLKNRQFPVSTKNKLKKINHHFGKLTKIEKDIITKFRWPLSLTPPKYPESALVCFIHKIYKTIQVKKSAGDHLNNLSPLSRSGKQK